MRERVGEKTFPQHMLGENFPIAQPFQFRERALYILQAPINRWFQAELATSGETEIFKGVNDLYLCS